MLDCDRPGGDEKVQDGVALVAQGSMLRSEVAIARDILIAEARRAGDEILLRRLLSHRRGDEKEKKEQQTPAARFLLKRAAETAAEDAKRRKDLKERERAAEADMEKLKITRAEARLGVQVYNLCATLVSVVMRCCCHARRTHMLFSMFLYHM